MTKLVNKLSPVLRPDSTRTVIRPFALSDPDGFAVIGQSRAERIAQRIISLDEAGIKAELKVLKDALDGRHREAERLLFDIQAGVEGLKIDRSVLSHDQTLLLGAYFSEEFSFESAALFNPSIVRHPDQSGMTGGDTRFVLSLRGIGEGHISSLTFRTGTWTAEGEVSIDKPSVYAVGPYIDRTQSEQGELVVSLSFDRAENICESVIYPFLPSQGRGIEDVRMVEFTDDDGSVDYRATYTAFNGSDVRQGLLRTHDFKNFEMRGVRGELYAGKGMALFPRKIGGRYFMLSRQDNENLWLTSSDDFSSWNGGEKIITPKWPWEFIQIGNCGSPIELDEGWLVLTHGVGIVRNYCLGACLLDKQNPSRLLARLEKPLIEPDGDARDGYVPNVVYSCGAILRDRTLLLPYGEADNFATFATMDVDALVAAMS
jgi:predicted GH43/DUF377 family glycosyl hydrolase